MNSSTSASSVYARIFATTLLSGLLASTALTEIFIRTQVLPRDTFVDYKSRFRFGEAEAVAFGDSHVASGLISLPGTIDNLGQPSDNLFTILEKARHRFARGGVSRVILQADPQIFSAYRLKADQKNRLKSLLQEGESPLVMMRPEYRQYLTQFWWAALSDPLEIFRIPTTDVASDLPPNINSWDQQQLRKEALIRVQLHSPILAFYNSPAATAYREGVLRLKRQGLQVCLVGFPVSSYYREGAKSLPSFAMVRAFFVDVARDLQVPYFDHASAVADDGFGDPDHLLPAAAAAFTHKILHDCFGGRYSHL